MAKRRRFVFFLYIIIAAALWSGCKKDSPIEQNTGGRYTLSGTVYSDFFVPLAGVRIQLGDSVKYSDNHGAFVFYNLPADNNRVLISDTLYKSIDTVLSFKENSSYSFQLYPRHSYFPLKIGNKWSYTYTYSWYNSMGGSGSYIYSVNWEVVEFDQNSRMFDILCKMKGPSFKANPVNFGKQPSVHANNKVMFDSTYNIKVQIKQDTLLIFNENLIGLSRLGPLYIKDSTASNDTLKFDNISFIKDVGISEYKGPLEFFAGTTYYRNLKLRSFQLK